MSQWVHVHGMVRVDSLFGIAIPGDTGEVITESFKNPPTGSEGELRVHPHQTREHNSLSWGYVAIENDLRDFGIEDVPEIEKWLRESIAALKAGKCHPSHES